MKILLTNDDGINAEGINALYNTFSREHEVYIVAPAVEQSGCSTAITFRTDIRVQKLNPNKYAVHGYTADCVNIGVKGVLIPKPDLVISGINHGANLGDDIYLSGTVGGARIAFMSGIPAVAVSLICEGKSDYFNDVSEFLLKYIDEQNLLSSGEPGLLNINYPDIPSDRICGVKYTTLGQRRYNDWYRVKSNSGNEIILEFKAGVIDLQDESSDVLGIKNGYITVTPLILDCTDYDTLSCRSVTD